LLTEPVRRPRFARVDIVARPHDRIVEQPGLDHRDPGVIDVLAQAVRLRCVTGGLGGLTAITDLCHARGVSREIQRPLLASALSMFPVSVTTPSWALTSIS
jgi:hypothetical protein